VDSRHALLAERGEDPLAVRQDGALVLAPSQVAHPGVEELHDLDPGGDLGAQIADGDLGERLHQAVPQGGVAVQQALGAGVVAAGAALDQVGRDRVRRAGEADQRRPVAEVAAQQPDGIEQLGRGGLGLDDPQRPDSRAVADGRVHDRADARIDRERHPHAVQRQHDVGVQHRAVDPEHVDRHAGDLRTEVRGARQGEDVVALAKLAVVGQAAASLSHEPHRRAVDRLPPGRRQQPLGRLHCRLAVLVAQLDFHTPSLPPLPGRGPGAVAGPGVRASPDGPDPRV
jgi:hypothetical protein